MKISRFLIISLFVLILPVSALAMPTQYGDSGLISVPTTEVTERGIFQSAVWFNSSENDGKKFTLLPVSLSMGIGDELEISGSYPNILLNDQNDGSMRAFENIGIKYRLIGEADSNFKTAIDAFVRQTVSNDETLNSLRDLGSRLMFSYRMANAEIHLNIGYLKVDSPSSKDYKNETLFGGAIEFPVSDRLRPFVELDGNSNRDGGSSRVELTPGMQYYLLPYLTAIGGVGFGLTDIGPDYRVMVGLTFGSGAGRYVKAIPVIPGSRERYAATSVSAEELMPELPIASKEGIAEVTGASPPPLPGVEGLEPSLVPPSPVATPTTALVKPAGKEVVTPGSLISPVEAPPVPMEPPMPQLMAMPVEKAATPEKTVLKPEIPAEVPVVTFAPPVPVGAAEVKVEEAPKPEIKAEVPALRKEVTAKGVIYRVTLFFYNKWELTPYVKGVLDKVAAEIKEIKEPLRITLSGHTDNTGKASYNKELSYKRAVNVKEYFVKMHSMDPNIFQVNGYGGEKPVASNETPEGRSENRRVEITVLFAKGQ